jgi:hypothetical protein
VLGFSTTGIAANDPITAAVWQRLQARSASTLAALERANVTGLLAGAEGIEDISFAEFLLPAGDGGLEFTPRLRSLAGKRIRLTGYMVRQATIQPGGFVLTPQPVTIESSGVCFAAEIPAHAVQVHAPAAQAGTRLPYRPGRLVVTGTLEIGVHREADGRNSAIRLVLDDSASFDRDVPADGERLSQRAPNP